MKTLARALILTTKYLNSRACDDVLDDDVAVLESISHELKKCSLNEKRCLIQVAKAPGVRIVVASPDEVNTYRGRAREIG